jgi:two-component system OmpR family sensor kinase
MIRTLRRLRRAVARAPLRVKLVSTLLLLLIGALLASGLAASTIMGSYLVSRVDDQLSSAAHRPGRDDDPELDSDDHSRLPSDFVLEVLAADGTTITGPSSNLADYEQALPDLPHYTARQIAAERRHFFTIDAVSGEGHWRVLAEPTKLPDGSTGLTLIAQSLADVERTTNRLTVLLAGIGGAAVVVFAAVGYLIVRASLRPLRDVEATAATIAAGDLTQRVPHGDPRTEIGRLSGALNTMLTEIETAFAERAVSEAAARRSEERMRRFVADASHELRTPLTTIRGFAELYRQAAGRDVDVPRLMRRIEDEAKRMGLLVEDLLLLARLDQQRPLAQLPVDVLALAGDAVHDARMLAPDRPITLDVGRTDPPPIVIGDEARLRQVLANLVGNALQHTPAGTAVTVRVATSPAAGDRRASVRLEVADAGPGLPEADAARVFERFFRADPARSRDEGGTGLGLAIVAALVAGHGGTVRLESRPGAGATFIVELPVADEPED